MIERICGLLLKKTKKVKNLKCFFKGAKIAINENIYEYEYIHEKQYK